MTDNIFHEWCYGRLRHPTFLILGKQLYWSMFEANALSYIAQTCTRFCFDFCFNSGFFVDSCDFFPTSLRWRHNGHDSVSNHQPRHYLLNRLLRCRSKRTSKLRVTGLCVGNSPETGEFPAQMASNAENVSIWWRHHVDKLSMWTLYQYIKERQQNIETQKRVDISSNVSDTCWSPASLPRKRQGIISHI